jgi:hypothetical protein
MILMPQKKIIKGPVFIVASSTSVYPSLADYVCDGSNDEVQIQAAINAANAVGGGKVFLLEGQFNIADTIKVYHEIIIEGSGPNATILQATTDLGAKYMFAYDSSSEEEVFIVKEFSVFGGRDLGTPNTDAFFNQGAGSGRVKDIYIINMNIMRFGSIVNPVINVPLPWGFRMQDTVIEFCNNDVLHLGDGSGVYRSPFLHNNKIRDNKGHSIVLNKASQYIIYGNEIDAGDGDDTSKYAIKVIASDGGIIMGNQISPTSADNKGSGVSIDGTSDYTIIANNNITIDATAPYGVTIASGAKGTKIVNTTFSGGVTQIDDNGTDTTIISPHSVENVAATEVNKIPYDIKLSGDLYLPALRSIDATNILLYLGTAAGNDFIINNGGQIFAVEGDTELTTAKNLKVLSTDGLVVPASNTYMISRSGDSDTGIYFDVTAQEFQFHRDGNVIARFRAVTNQGDITANRNLIAENGYLDIEDGVTAPGTSSGRARIYVDSADGDLKVKFGDGTVKTIVTDS